MNVEDAFRRNVRTFYAWLGSMILLGGGPIGAKALIDSGSLGARLTGVAVGVLSMVPWLTVIVAVVRRGDEFTRRLHLISASIALAGTVLMLSAADWLHRAKFIDAPNLMLLWIASLLIWLVALLGVKRYFERAL